MGEAVAIAALIMSAAGSAYSASEQRAASSERRRAQKEANDIKAATEKARENQQRKQQLREARIRRARLLQSSENSGVAAGSGEIGASGAITTQVGSNIAFMRGQGIANEAISTTLQQGEDRAAGHMANAGVGQFVSSTASSVFGMWAGSKAGMETLNNIFS